MTAKKKIVKKKLKQPDEFISFTEKAFIFITHHFKKIALGFILLLFVLLAIFLIQRWENQKEEEASRKFNFALEAYQITTSPYREGTPKEYKNILEKFEEVISTYPRSSSGKLSLLYKGDIHLKLGEFEEAIKTYQAFLQKTGKEKLYRLFALENLGYAYEGKKDYEKALHSYQEVLKLGENFQWPNTYLNIARCYEKMGKNNEALENYKAFIRISQKSSLTNTVLRKISNLEK